jgi:FkbM family methyltransferase
MTCVRSDLIYDVGLFDGSDTAYYLFRGYNVVAVDANPSMIDRAKSRFASEIATKRLTLLNLGISNAPGTATFWISAQPEWSSFNRSIASRNGTSHAPVCVPVVPFCHILQEHGIPHYLKIDIEGHDQLCIDALRGKEIPKYISVEAECGGDSAPLSDDEALSMLQLLRDVGYSRFKLVNQLNLSPLRSSAAGRFSMRLMTSVARGRLRTQRLSGWVDRFTDLGRIQSLGFGFAPGCSGPWGDDIPSSWMTFHKARSLFLRKRHSHFSRERLAYSFWYDWHATY